MIHLSWHNCYSEGWQNEIVPEAFSHPAKFSRALIRRIYAYALERGYLKPGDTCLDPFGGVALGAADALANGLNFVGVELEQNFVDLGGGCDCTGISKSDWVRCFGRWDRFRYKDGRHWCPRCLAGAGQISKERKAPGPSQAQAKRRARMRELMTRTGRKVDFSLYVPIPFPESCERQAANAARLFGAEPLTSSYRRSSGKIPHTRPHRYAGNLELFARHARGGATAVLIQGDSRNLVEVLEGARAEGIVASPPYANSLSDETSRIDESKYKNAKSRKGQHRQVKLSQRYGTDPANLGNMPTGEPPSAIVSSPPFSPDQPCASQTQAIKNYHAFTRGDGTKRDHVMRSSGNIADMPTGEPPSAMISSPPLGKAQSGGTSFWEGLEEKHNRTFSDKVREGSQGYREDQLGDSEGQLGTMPTGEPPQAVIASPPHGVTGVGHDAGHPRLDAAEDTRRAAEGCRRRPAYGESDGQLAAMREGDVDAVIASPPYINALNPHGEGPGMAGNEAQRKRIEAGSETEGAARSRGIGYGQTDGQLAALPEGDVDAVIASPPWTSTSACEDPNYRTDRQASGGPLYNDYGDSDGQLAALPEGEPPKVDGLVSSPPYWDSLERHGEKPEDVRARMREKGWSQESIRKVTIHSNDTQSGYGVTEGQLAAETQPDTFWAASRAILLQCHEILAPGGVAIFVTKRFVRNKQIVEFSQQWADLCQSSGFELIEWIKAWLVEERGTQYDLEGEAHTKTVKRFSFFRRLHAQKYPHLAIEWEDVLIFRKSSNIMSS